MLHRIQLSHTIHQAPAVLCRFVVVLVCLSGGLASAGGRPAPAPAAAPTPVPALGEHCYKGLKDPNTAVAPVGTRQHPAAASPALAAWPPSPSGRAALPTPARTRKAIRDLMALEQLADIEVASFNKETAELLVIGPAAAPGQGLRFDDWLVVLRALVFHGPPGVSIDPGPTPERMVVRYFGGIERTALGAIFFEADRSLKLLSTGFDNRTCGRVAPGLATLPTTLDLMAAEVRQTRGHRGPQWHRYWFELSEESVEVSEDGLAMRVPIQRLVVKEEALTPETESPSSARVFATRVSHHLLDLAARIPALADLHRQAALVQLAKWMVDQGIPVDQRWLESAPAMVPTPQTTPSITALKATLEDDTYVQVGIYGGVDFDKPNTYAPERGVLTRALHAAVHAAPRDATSWDFALEGRPYHATRLQYEHPVILRRPATP